jgi:hypothetical protein
MRIPEARLPHVLLPRGPTLQEATWKWQREIGSHTRWREGRWVTTHLPTMSRLKTTALAFTFSALRRRGCPWPLLLAPENAQAPVDLEDAGFCQCYTGELL